MQTLKALQGSHTNKGACSKSIDHGGIEHLLTTPQRSAACVCCERAGMAKTSDGVELVQRCEQMRLVWEPLGQRGSYLALERAANTAGAAAYPLPVRNKETAYRAYCNYQRLQFLCAYNFAYSICTSNFCSKSCTGSYALKHTLPLALQTLVWDEVT
jgi:hypothetical protein